MVDDAGEFWTFSSFLKRAIGGRYSQSDCRGLYVCVCVCVCVHMHKVKSYSKDSSTLYVTSSRDITN